MPWLRLLVILPLLSVLFLAGCGKTRFPDSGTTAGAVSFKRVLPEPLTNAGIEIVPRQEAEKLSRAMTSSLGGAAHIKALDFSAEQSLAHLSGFSAEAVALEKSGLRITYGQLRDSMLHLRSILPRLASSPELLADDFTWYRIGPDFGITGYYEPTLKASRVYSSTHQYPLYRLPPDWQKGKPYFSRRQIDREGKLSGKGLELVWVDSDVDAFFLHVQGSGRLLFEDGYTSHILFAGHNNLSYRSLAGIMKKKGLLGPDNISMQSIKAVLAANPALKAGLFDENPRYVFFREADAGPVGAMGRPLTPWVSVASDRGILPHGILGFLAVALPSSTGSDSEQKRFFGLVMPQDVGGAIKGNRLDLFCGAGQFAEQIAGRLDSRGAVYILLKK